MRIFLICFFLGYFGIHRFLLGYKNWWLMLLTLGGLGIWQLIDLINIATGRMQKTNIKVPLTDTN